MNQTMKILVVLLLLSSFMVLSVSAEEMPPSDSDFWDPYREIAYLEVDTESGMLGGWRTTITTVDYPVFFATGLFVDGYLTEIYYEVFMERFIEDTLGFVRALSQEHTLVQQYNMCYIEMIYRERHLDNYGELFDQAEQLARGLTLTEEDGPEVQQTLDLVIKTFDEAKNPTTGDFVFVPVALMLLSGTGLAWLSRRKKLV